MVLSVAPVEGLQGLDRTKSLCAHPACNRHRWMRPVFGPFQDNGKLSSASSLSRHPSVGNDKLPSEVIERRP
jgi:hypothetical protein